MYIYRYVYIYIYKYVIIMRIYKRKTIEKFIIINFYNIASYNCVLIYFF